MMPNILTIIQLSQTLVSDLVICDPDVWLSNIVHDDQCSVLRPGIVINPYSAEYLKIY